MSKIIVYHGSFCVVEKPSLTKGRSDADFGIGFYVTPELEMAKKWASRKKNAVINEYILDTNGLSSYVFSVDKIWLDFVIQNRTGKDVSNFTERFDFLSGTTADDRLFATIEQYEDGLVSSEVAIKTLNCMKIGQQFCIRTQKGLDHLTFQRATKLTEKDVLHLQEMNKKERILANQLTAQIIREANK